MLEALRCTCPTECFFFVYVAREDLDSGVLAGYGGLGGFHGTFLEC